MTKVVKKLLSFIIKNIIEHSKEVQIEEKKENGLIALELSVHSSDMGKVIGRGGKIISAIRNLLKIKAIRENKRFSLDLKED